MHDWNASTTALKAFTVHFAHALEHTPVKVDAAHPGSVATDGNPAGTLTVEVGARTAVQLATLAADGHTGGFFHLGQAFPWWPAGGRLARTSRPCGKSGSNGSLDRFWVVWVVGPCPASCERSLAGRCTTS